MIDIGNMSQEKKGAELNETEQRKPDEMLKKKDQLKKNDNQIVKLDMAEELIKMGITKSSAYRILNIRNNTNKDV